MKAFVEILSGVVRVGPECEKYGDPFELAVAFSCADGHHAVVKGLVSGGGGSIVHARAGTKALNDIGLIPIWERIK